MIRKLLSLLLCLLLLWQGAAADVAVHQVQNLVDDIAAFQKTGASVQTMQEWLNVQPAGTGAEWYVIALSQSGPYDFSAYRAKLQKYLDETTVHAASSRQKFALTLLCVDAGNPYIDRVMEDSIGKQGVMSWIYGLHLLNNGRQSTAATVESAVDTLLSLQLPDGGWALTGTVSDVDITAMALQALAPHAARYTEEIARALTLLSNRQLENGSFASYGVPNPESAAQVLLALAELGIDGLTDPRFIKNGSTILDSIRAFQLPDGSFSHKSGGAFNYTATAQVFFALTGYLRLMNGQPAIYLLDRKTDTASQASFTLSYREIAALAVAALALLSCLLLFFLKKRHRKNFLSVFILAAAAIAIIYTVDFQSADSYYSAQPAVKAHAVGSVTLSIRCDTVVGKSDASYIPQNGVILPETVFDIEDGDTVYDILTEAVRAHRIPMEVSGPQGMIYVSGLNHLYEYAFGDLSGWTYWVNGQSPSVGCAQYALSAGDEIIWHYTCELGNDLK